MTSPLLTDVDGGAHLRVRLQPRASRDRIGPVAEEELRIHVTAPPVDSAANEALVRLLASELGVARSRVQILRGRSSRHKVVFVGGMDSAKITSTLSLG